LIGLSGLPGSAIIIGAGLGGLTAGLSLLRAGWRVEICEQSLRLGEAGAGISVSSGAGKGLESLGVGPELLAASTPAPNVAFVHYQTGERLAGEFHDGAPPDLGFATPRHIHRADLHAILLKAVLKCDSSAVRVGKTLNTIDQNSDRAVARFVDGDHAAGDVIVAADGLRSTARGQLFGEQAPTFAGQIAFRCLVPADVAAPFLHQGNAVVSVGDGRIFHRYLIRGGKLVNVIGIARSDHWRGEGWNTPSSTEEFRDAFRGFHADVADLIARTPPDTLIKWALFQRPPIPCWSIGRVTLLGDAAHPILPFLGLGAALAIEDGVVIGRVLDRALDVPTRLKAFQAARAERVERVRLDTIRQGEIIQGLDPDGSEVSRSPSQDVTLYDYDPTTVPIDV
jgi:salicylate hydroxylase